MKPNSQKNRKMLGEFPFIGRSILSMTVEPWDDADVLRVDSLAIHVEKADGDLMYRRADNVGLGENSFCFSSKKERDGQIMRQSEFIVAVDENDTVVNQVFWPKNREEARGRMGMKDAANTCGRLIFFRLTCHGSLKKYSSVS